MARLSSRSFIDCLLSYSFLPRAMPMTSFASPRSLMNSRNGTIVNPASRPFFFKRAIYFRFNNSLRSRLGAWFFYVP